MHREYLKQHNLILHCHSGSYRLRNRDGSRRSFFMGIIVIDLPKQASRAVPFLFHSTLRQLLYKLFLIDLLHLRNQHGQICCRHIEDAGICRELAVNISHHFVGTMACPVKDRSGICAGAFLELIIRNKSPLWELLPELFRHVRVTTEKQNALLYNICISNNHVQIMTDCDNSR